MGHVLKMHTLNQAIIRRPAVINCKTEIRFFRKYSKISMNLPHVSFEGLMVVVGTSYLTFLFQYKLKHIAMNGANGELYFLPLVIHLILETGH